MPRLRFQPQGIELDVPRGTRLVDAVRSAGLPIARACGDDLVCARCGVRVLAGKVGRESQRERAAKARNRIAPELRLACALRVNADLEISADYWGRAWSRALLVVDHGSRQPEAHAHLETIASELRRRRPELAVYVAHLELSQPTVEEAIATAARDGVDELIVHPLFLAPGVHASSDVPRQVEAAASAYPQLRVRFTPALGSVAQLADLILGTLPKD